MSSIRLADGRNISDYGNPYIVAEVNSSHNGNIEVAKAMIDAAIDVGCDCVKFQSWSTKTLYSKSYYDANPIAKRFVDKLSMSSDDLKQMYLYCKDRGIGFSSTPYSNEEVDFLAEECSVPFIKIASMEANNPEFLEYIAKKNLPIIISTGMADYDEVRKAVKIIEDAGNTNIAILHCVSIYPTPIDKAGLNNILELRKIFPMYPIGYSDHTLGDEASIAAVALGAAVIEKHITLDSSKIGMDNQMAMEPEPLRGLIKKCRGVSSSLGTMERILYPEELKQRENMRRSIVVTRDMFAGEIVSRADLDVKRPGNGLEPNRMSEVIGRTLKNDVKCDTLLFETDIV